MLVLLCIFNLKPDTSPLAVLVLQTTAEASVIGIRAKYANFMPLPIMFIDTVDKN